MRALNVSEISAISGGYDNQGYNFSFVVRAIASGVISGGVLDLVLKTDFPAFTLLMGGGSAIVSTALLITTALDNYVFPEDDSLLPDSE